MTERKHVLVADWASGDFTSEQARMQPHGISIAGSGIVRTDSVEEKHAKLKRAIEAAERIDALMFCIAPIDAEIISMLPDDCKLLQRNGTGLDNVDLEKAAELGKTVRNTPRYCVEEVAVHAMGMLLSLHRQLGQIQERMLGGEWSGMAPMPIRRLSTLTLGVLGFGRIGRKLGQLMRPLVKNVVYYDEIGADVDWATPMELYDVLQTADLLSMHLPATAQTQHIINRETLAVMKDTAILINAARGALVDAWALAAALNEGRLGGAGLDVFTPEIPPMDSPLRTAKNILLTSHAAWYSEDAIRDAREEAVESVIEFMGGD